MKKVLILANHFITIYAFRRELVKELLEQKYVVYIALPKSDENKYFKDIGCEIIETPLDRRGTNPIADIKLLFQYISVIKDIKPDLVLTYTIKPNTYGGIAARICKVKTLHTVTGLGSVYIQDMWQKNIAIILNKIAFKNASKVVFLNEDNKAFYKEAGIISSFDNTLIVPGSGVNLKNFQYVEQPADQNIIFTFVGRVLKDKGIEEFLSVAKEVSKKNSRVKFQVVGFVDEEKYIELLRKYENEGIIKYLGKRNDIPDIMAKSSCIVLPSYGEGRGTVLQEGAAIGRPLITCNTYGCKDNVDEGYNGYLCNVADTQSLKNAIEKFILLPSEEKELMGKRSREKAEREFDRKIVIETYISEVKKIIEGKD
ncbi:glycosyltransferase family 4 protein [Alkalihalophilus lindianensis]|uniref:Glycosyltransferase family 4 protein n=1 Tax=Alkalihalophilus lindianensis TaxID=1630542 RepID=A0ABU3X945_9BACI|nr:glycosyltransferase family 4 protein [Alkalihalophilus lindianensis]MDV2684412.1 glycosyltransferase family 4 protein [Alkalihalophilus lindianensis]